MIGKPNFDPTFQERQSYSIAEWNWDRKIWTDFFAEEQLEVAYFLLLPRLPNQ